MKGTGEGQMSAVRWPKVLGKQEEAVGEAAPYPDRQVCSKWAAAEEPTAPLTPTKRRGSAPAGAGAEAGCLPCPARRSPAAG